MKLEALVFVLVCRCQAGAGVRAGAGVGYFEINGELSFDLNLSDLGLNLSNLSLNQSEKHGHGGLGGKMENRQVTSGSVVECIYQYPEQEQVNAILSNMMNELTKVFVRAHDYFANEDGRRSPETRFRVVDHMKTQFFEHIYHNMTHEYSELYNSTAGRVVRAGADPCHHQEEIKQVWRELLDHSLATFRRAALRCVEDYLRVERSDARTRGRLGQFLARELAKVRSNQLHFLCDHFQLCYNDLL